MVNGIYHYYVVSDRLLRLPLSCKQNDVSAIVDILKAIYFFVLHSYTRR